MNCVWTVCGPESVKGVGVSGRDQRGGEWAESLPQRQQAARDLLKYTISFNIKCLLNQIILYFILVRVLSFRI